MQLNQQIEAKLTKTVYSKVKDKLISDSHWYIWQQFERQSRTNRCAKVWQSKRQTEQWQSQQCEWQCTMRCAKVWQNKRHSTVSEKMYQGMTKVILFFPFHSLFIGWKKNKFILHLIDIHQVAVNHNLGFVTLET